MNEVICLKCKLSLPMDRFNKNKSKKTGIQTYCRECQNVIDKENYRTSKKTRDRVRANNILARINNRAFVLEYLKTNPCIDCGNNNVLVLQFDHIVDKKYDISYMTRCSYSTSSIRKEIEKCEVRCANCHLIKTEERRIKKSYRSG